MLDLAIGRGFSNLSSTDFSVNHFGEKYFPESNNPGLSTFKLCTGSTEEQCGGQNYNQGLGFNKKSIKNEYKNRMDT